MFRATGGRIPWATGSIPTTMAGIGILIVRRRRGDGLPSTMAVGSSTEMSAGPGFRAGRGVLHGWTGGAEVGTLDGRHCRLTTLLPMCAMIRDTGYSSGQTIFSRLG